MLNSQRPDVARQTGLTTGHPSLEVCLPGGGGSGGGWVGRTAIPRMSACTPLSTYLLT